MPCHTKEQKGDIPTTLTIIIVITANNVIVVALLKPCHMFPHQTASSLTARPAHVLSRRSSRRHKTHNLSSKHGGDGFEWEPSASCPQVLPSWVIASVLHWGKDEAFWGEIIRSTSCPWRGIRRLLFGS